MDPLSKRAERIREKLAQLALERAAEYERRNHDPDTPAPEYKPSRQERRLLNQLEGLDRDSGYKFPGCSPSHTHESEDLIQRTAQRMTRAKMREDFERRAREKRGDGQTNNIAPRPRGKAGVLW